MWRKGNPSVLLVGMQTGAATVENSMEFPQNTKDELPFGPVIPLLGLYHKRHRGKHWQENPDIPRSNVFTDMSLKARDIKESITNGTPSN